MIYEKSVGNETSVTSTISVIKSELGKATRLKTEINFQNAQLSGITIVKAHGDTLSGAFITEFGLKGFEFNLYHNSCKVFNLMSKLNKWYIRKTLENDLLFTFNRYQSNKTLYINGKEYRLKTLNNKISSVSIVNNNKLIEQLTVENDSVFSVDNRPLNIQYRFQKLGN